MAKRDTSKTKAARASRAHTSVAASSPPTALETRPDVPQAERVLMALELRYGQGMKYTVARATLMEHFGITKSTAEDDLHRSRMMASQQLNEQLPHLPAETAARYLRVMDKAEAAGDAAEEAGLFSAAAAAYAAVGTVGRTLQRLLGLDAPKKASGPARGLRLTTAAQRGRIQELLQAAAERAAAAAKNANPPAQVIDVDEAEREAG